MKVLDRLTDAKELALRHVHPNFVKAGRLTSEAFNPTKSHQFMLSVHRSSLTSADACFAGFVEGGRRSVGVLAVAIGECDACATPVFHAPTDPDFDPADSTKDESHAVVDFNSLPSKGARERAATMLRDHAVRRGYLYPPGAGTAHGIGSFATTEGG